ncbi:transcriptional regulator, partial [Wolbachia endosymbiont of Drosophila barbarae]
EKMKIAKNLVKEGISINIILKTVGISLDEIQQI